MVVARVATVVGEVPASRVRTSGTRRDTGPAAVRYANAPRPVSHLGSYAWTRRTTGRCVGGKGTVIDLEARTG